MYIPDESGINSLGGFAYQIKVFVSYMLSMEEGMQAEFETADDIAISKMTPDIIDDNEDKFRNLIVSPNGIKAIQVKRTSITEKVAKQVLLNWMLLEKSGKTITNYILFTDKSYKNSATGTGKTYASAFAMRNEKPKKALFIVHRELIARQALKSYKKVFGSMKKLALLSGNSKEYDADILFATMSMMAKSETLERYKTDEFDWICIDEVHRAGSESYQKIMNYFQPDFWLGMTIMVS